MKEKEVCTQDYVEEIAWRALMNDPKVVYEEWVEDIANVEELVDLFDYLNDKLNGTHCIFIAETYRDEFFGKLRAARLAGGVGE